MFAARLVQGSKRLVLCAFVPFVAKAHSRAARCPFFDFCPRIAEADGPIEHHFLS